MFEVFLRVSEVLLGCVREPEADLELTPLCSKGGGDDGGATAEPWPGTPSKQPNSCGLDH